MSSPSQPMYGVVSINGQQFIERWQVIPYDLAMTVNNQRSTLKLPLPGTYDFRLKGLTRDTLVNGASSVKRFRAQLGNTDGNVLYSQGPLGIGGTTDLVLDSLLFGTGQFPYAIIPPIFYGKNSAIILNVEDITGAATGSPYTISFGFHGAYLIPV